MPGSTDCPFEPPYTFDSQPGVSGDRHWRPDRHHRPDWNNHGNWNNHGGWKNHDGKRHHRRHVRRGGNVTIGIWGGPGYYDDTWYEPDYLYVEPAPRRRVIHLSAAHIDWCYATRPIVRRTTPTSRRSTRAASASRHIADRDRRATKRPGPSSGAFRFLILAVGSAKGDSVKDFPP
jgi:hypothetical protein